MDNKALIQAMLQLTEKMTDYEHFGLTIERAHNEMARLDGEIASLRKTVAGELWEEDAPVKVIVRSPAHGKRGPDKTPRRFAVVSNLKSPAAIQALETLKASNLKEGVPARDLGKPWVISLLSRAGYAKHLPNGNWAEA